MTTNENRNYTGKVAFVTGAANGIGRATALAFAREGASVVVADVSEQGNQETARLIEDLGGRSLAVKCDVTRPEDVKAALDKTIEAFGRLDFAFNNAGVEQKNAATAEIEEAEWERIVNINLRGVFLCMRAQITDMTSRGRGAVVNIASAGGLIGTPGLAGYCASKHAVIGLTKTAALEYASRGIRINAVCPGPVETPMMAYALQDPERRVRIASNPMGRVAEAQEIADAVCYLCSDAASFITGVALPVDGGLTAR